MEVIGEGEMDYVMMKEMEGEERGWMGVMKKY